MPAKVDKAKDTAAAPLALINVDRALSYLHGAGLSEADAAKHLNGIVASDLSLVDYVLIERATALVYLTKTGMPAPDAETLLKGLSTHLQRPIQQDLKAAHLAALRRGFPAKLDTDPDLRAFVTARLATHTFPALAEAVRQNFPKSRRVSQSSIHRFWLKTKGQNPPQ